MAEKIRHDDEKITRRQGDAGRKTDRHQAGFDDAARRIGGAGDHGLRVALAHHHAAEIKRLPTRRAPIAGVMFSRKLAQTAP